MVPKYNFNMIELTIRWFGYGFQTKLVFKQRFKLKKNEKNKFIKVILKLECLFYQNIYIFYFILSYTRRAILTQTNPKSVLVEKKTCHNMHRMIGKVYKWEV